MGVAAACERIGRRGSGAKPRLSFLKMDKFSFSRFTEKRNYKVSRFLWNGAYSDGIHACMHTPSPHLSFSRCDKSSDTTGYDEYVEGVEPDETASLETHIGEVGKTIIEPQHRSTVCMYWATGMD